jgi:hypothetical protein
MKYSEWRTFLASHDNDVKTARENWERAAERRDKFLKETLGFMPNDLATLEGMSDMISKVMEMKKEES